MPWLLWNRNRKGESYYLIEAVDEALQKMVFIKWKM